MLYFIYAIKDVKRGQFMNIWTESNDATAKRNFDTIRKDPKTIFGIYPTDFELWSLGTYEANTGVITSDIRYVEGGTPIEVFQQRSEAGDYTE